MDTARVHWTMCASAAWDGRTRGATKAVTATTTAPAPREWASVMSASTGPPARTVSSAVLVPMATHKTLKVGVLFVASVRANLLASQSVSLASSFFSSCLFLVLFLLFSHILLVACISVLV